MIRTMRSNNPFAIWWRKKGRGTMHLLDGRKIKEGEKFQATEAEVVGMENWLESLEDKPSEKRGQGVVKKTEFFLKQRNAAWWDVVDTQGKIKNENALRKGQAEELKQDLEN